MGIVSGIKSPPLARTPPLSHGIYIDRCISLRYVLLEAADLLAASNYIMYNDSPDNLLSPSIYGTYKFSKLISIHFLYKE